jgi:Pectate lyase superfamily protein
MASRRELLRAGGVVAGGALLVGGAGGAAALAATTAPAPADPWDQVPVILGRVVPPVFPAKDFPIVAYGAKGDGRTDCTAAFAKAIAAANAAGGGRVTVPKGTWSTGAIHLLRSAPAGD